MLLPQTFTTGFIAMLRLIVLASNRGRPCVLRRPRRTMSHWGHSAQANTIADALFSSTRYQNQLLRIAAMIGSVADLISFTNSASMNR